MTVEDMVGIALRRNKGQIPTESLDHKTAQCEIKYFVYDENMTLLSCKTKRNKTVILLPTTYFSSKINQETTKPEIIY